MELGTHDLTLSIVSAQAASISAIRAAVPDLVINARVDTFLVGNGGLEDAVSRANAYLSAGADCVYPIFCPASVIAELAGRIDGPINILLTPQVPSVSQLADLGVARVTWGAGLAGLAYAEAARVAAGALSGE